MTPSGVDGIDGVGAAVDALVGRGLDPAVGAAFGVVAPLGVGVTALEAQAARTRGSNTADQRLVLPIALRLGSDRTDSGLPERPDAERTVSASVSIQVESADVESTRPA
jgi:hypothetical protein